MTKIITTVRITDKQKQPDVFVMTARRKEKVSRYLTYLIATAEPMPVPKKRKADSLIFS